jgi:flagellar biosynthesis protein FliR
MSGTEFNIPGLNLFNLTQYLIIFFIASLRISSFLISAPFFSSGSIPLQARIVVSL